MRKKKLYAKKDDTFKSYLRRTFWNKLMAVSLISIGICSAWLSNGDITFLIFALIGGIPMFFAKKDIREL